MVECHPSGVLYESTINDEKTMDELFELAEEDRQTVEFMKAYLPQDVKGKFTDDDLYYLHDVMLDYFNDSGVLDQEPDAEGYIDIDTEKVAEVLQKQAKKDQIGDFTLDDLLWVVQGELEFGE